MFPYFLQSKRTILLIIGALAVLIGGGVYAADDDSENSSIGFFERMGVKAPASEETKEAIVDTKSSVADTSEVDSNAVSERAVQLSGDVEQKEAVTPGDEEADRVTTEPSKLAKDEQLFEAAFELYNAMELKDAIPAFVKVLNYEQVRPEIEKKTLIYLARIYYQLDMPLRTISLMELYMSNFPGDPRREEIIFQTGKIHRELGQFDAAIAAFYRVLNSIIRGGEDNMKSYLDLARKAQFEIARTHFYLGEWPQALDLFQRISLFELGPEDRETLRFYKARALIYVGKLGEGLREIDQFAAQYPQSPFLAELKYEKARALIDMKQFESGRRSLMELVEMGGAPEDNMTEEWVEWRRIAGNFLSNYYYELGDFETALRLYQAIVVMDDSPQWQLPVVMQMAACFRELGQLDRATESLEFVVQEVRAMRERADAGTLSVDLEFLEDSASWQLDLLQWRQDFEGQLQAGAGNQ